jgi:hypothetical protein
MSTLKHPVGPQPSKVYWRRRLIVGLGALAVIIVIILIVVQPRGSGAPAGANPTSSSTPQSTKTTTAPAAGKDCAAANVKVEAVTDKVSYPAGVNPVISMKITNTGSVACIINLGSTQQDLKVTSGSETIWDSKDCQTDAVDATVTLEPNVPKTTPGITWDRTRSSKTTCSGTRPPVTAGGASYHLTASVGDRTSKETVQFLLY